MLPEFHFWKELYLVTCFTLWFYLEVLLLRSINYPNWKILNNNFQLKQCSRCKKNIECCASNIDLCACINVKISADAVTYLKQTKHDCLCNKCLIEINDLMKKMKQYQFPTTRSEMILGVHYYVENGYFVFTELYHMLRGKCCQSGCRHCAYGFKN